MTSDGDGGKSLIQNVIALFPTPALLLENGVVRSANQAAVAMLGRAEADLVGEVVANLVERSKLHIDVEVREVDEHIAIATLADRTAQFEAERALREEEDRLSHVVRCAPGAIFSLRMRPDGSSAVPYASVGMESLFGLSRDALAEDGAHLGDIILPEDRTRLRAELLEAATAGAMVATEFRAFVNGDTKTVEVRMAPTTEADGSILFHGFANDITSTVRTWNELREAETRFTQAFQLSPIGFLMTSLVDFRVLEVNAAYLEMWKVSRSAVIGRPANELPARMPDEVAQVVEQRLMTEHHIRDLEYAFTSPDGEKGHARVSLTVLERNGAPYLLTMISDVTAEKRAQAERAAFEDRLRQSQRLESVGRLAGGVAHDFNNCLTVLAGYTEELSETIPLTESLREVMDEMRHAIERGSSLTRDLLTFGRQEILEPRVEDLNDLVGDATRMVRRVLSEDIDLVVSLDRSCKPVLIDRQHWSSVILNLCLHGRDAMPRGGRIEVRTRAGRGSDTGDVFLEVSDTSAGVSAEECARMFEPFHSGARSGLGLSVVHGIVAQSGGRIEVESVVDRGTKFTIRLPTTTVEARATLHPHDELRKGIILVAEDEDRVRRLACRALRANGFEVLEAANGDDALRALEGAPKVDLLLTDLIMPGMTGRELAEEAKRRRPDLSLLYTTGYTQDDVARTGIRKAEVAFLQKPFTVTSLLTAVKRALAKPLNA